MVIMGQALNSHELFVEGLKKVLKARGIKVKIHDLLTFFFDFIKEICPWFPLEDTIDLNRFEHVGSAIKDYYKVFGPEKVPVTAFSFWNFIEEVLSFNHLIPRLQKLLKREKKALLLKRVLLLLPLIRAMPLQMRC